MGASQTGGAVGGLAGMVGGPFGSALGSGLGSLLGGLFQRKPSLRELPTNPFIDQLAYLPYEMGPARKYYKGILKGATTGDYTNQPGIQQFNVDEATAAEEARRTPSLQLGPMAQRQRELQVERQKQQIGGNRAMYIGGQLQDAAGGLAQMWQSKNMFNAANLADAAKLRQGQYSYA